MLYLIYNVFSDIYEDYNTDETLDPGFYYVSKSKGLFLVVNTSLSTASDSLNHMRNDS